MWWVFVRVRSRRKSLGLKCLGESLDAVSVEDIVVGSKLVGDGVEL